MDPLYELSSRVVNELAPEWPPPLLPGGVIEPRSTSPAASPAWIRDIWTRAQDVWDGIRRQRERWLASDETPVPPSNAPEGSPDHPIRATLRNDLRADRSSSIHVRRLLVARALYRDPALAIAATRLARRYPRYYEELAREMV